MGFIDKCDTLREIEPDTLPITVSASPDGLLHKIEERVKPRKAAQSRARGPQTATTTASARPRGGFRVELARKPDGTPPKAPPPRPKGRAAIELQEPPAPQSPKAAPDAPSAPPPEQRRRRRRDEDGGPPIAVIPVRNIDSAPLVQEEAAPSGAADERELVVPVPVPSDEAAPCAETAAPAGPVEAPPPDDAAGESKGEKRRDSGSGLSEFTDRRDRRKQRSPEESEDKRTGEWPFNDRRRLRRTVSGANTLTSMNLRKNFGRKEIVRGVGFSIRGGTIAGLLGPNGAGKTTIFYMIVGFYKPTTGDIKLNNVSIIHGPMYRRAQMGIAYLPQEASIFRKLTVEDNIWAILESRRDINKKQKKEKLEALLEDFSIGRIRKQYGYTLSGGERRRTEIARALAIEPKFLLLDEPFAGIDPIAVFEIKQIIKRLAKEGIGILITDHNVRDTLEITTDAFIINHGVIVARGDKDLILANQTVRDVYLGSEFKM